MRLVDTKQDADVQKCTSPSVPMIPLSTQTVDSEHIFFHHHPYTVLSYRLLIQLQHERARVMESDWGQCAFQHCPQTDSRSEADTVNSHGREYDAQDSPHVACASRLPELCPRLCHAFDLPIWSRPRPMEAAARADVGVTYRTEITPTIKR